MRVAAFATLAAVAVAAPFAMKALASGMSEDEFVRAAQCLAYDRAVPAAGETAAALRGQLAFAQHAQSETAVERARAEIEAVRDAAGSEPAPVLRAAREAACAPAASMAGKAGPDRTA